MGQDPGELREEIAATRDRMSETADGLADKVNVRARVKQKVTAKKDALLDKAREVAPANRQQAQQQALDSTKRATAAVRRNPQPVAIAGGLAAAVAVAAFWRARRSDQPTTISASTNGLRRSDTHRRRSESAPRRAAADRRRR